MDLRPFSIKHFTHITLQIKIIKEMKIRFIILYFFQLTDDFGKRMKPRVKCTFIETNLIHYI